MKNNLFKILALLIASTSFAQKTDFYYFKGSKKQLLIDRSQVSIYVSNDFNPSSIENLVLKIEDFQPNFINPNEKWAKVILGNNLTEIEYLQKVNTLKNIIGVTSVCRYYQNGKYESVGTSNLFYVKLKTEADTLVLKQLAIEKKATIHHKNKYMPQWVALTRNIDAAETSMEMSSVFYETGLFDAIDPAFIAPLSITPIISSTPNPVITTVPTCSNDIQSVDQWGLDRINACQAWNSTQGSGVKVAVFDTGVQLNHPDLSNNIAPISYDVFTNGTQTVYNPHGTYMAGIIGAERNNNIQITGVAPQSKLISISHPDNSSLSNIAEIMADGFNWARIFGKADVINCSWGFRFDAPVMINYGYRMPILEDAIDRTLTQGRTNKGCVIVFASGNEHGWLPIRYPALLTQDTQEYDPRLLVVGASDLNNNRADFSNYGTALDIVAPGTDVLTTSLNGNTYSTNGTSLSAPHVSGVAALILSVCPNFTGQQVRDIIEQTAVKIHENVAYHYDITKPNGTWNNEVGHGLLDAAVAVQLAQEMGHLDLIIKDDAADTGIQPNPATVVWNSPNIWLRQQADGLTNQTHQNVQNGVLNHAYVKVRNKNCPTSSGNEILELYQTVNTWGLQIPGNPIVSDLVLLTDPSNPILIPALAAGQETILHIPFFNQSMHPGHSPSIQTLEFGLIAKIVSSTDQLYAPETGNHTLDVKNNNNIALKNCRIVYAAYNPTEELMKVSVKNPTDAPKLISIEMVKEDAETGKAIYDEAEVGIKMDDVLYNAWQRGGKQEQNLEQTADAKKQIVENNRVLIDNIQLNPHEEGFVNLSFSFLTNELTNKTNYKYHIIQRDKSTNKIVDALTYDINKVPRPVFEANAGEDKEKDKNETITISAQQINEPAIYNWYDSEGNLVYTGKDLTISNEVSKKYKLEVIATADGFKDYSEVEVKLKPSTLGAIAPNPVTDNVRISYKINEGGSAYIMVLGSYGTNYASNNYIINPELCEININLSNYANGFYTVALMVNGQVVDAKTVVKEAP